MHAHLEETHYAENEGKKDKKTKADQKKKNDANTDKTKANGAQAKHDQRSDAEIQE